jgi:hypothetical protein
MVCLSCCVLSRAVLCCAVLCHAGSCAVPQASPDWLPPGLRCTPSGEGGCGGGGTQRMGGGQRHVRVAFLWEGGGTSDMSAWGCRSCRGSRSSHAPSCAQDVLQHRNSVCCTGQCTRILSVLRWPLPAFHRGLVGLLPSDIHHSNLKGLANLNTLPAYLKCVHDIRCVKLYPAALYRHVPAHTGSSCSSSNKPRSC